MELYFAPMEGITIYSFRQVHHRFFPGMDRYYSPFLVATQTHSFKKREIREILPENNQGICLIPQILGNHAEDCLEAIRTLSSYGYREINFNLGCSMPQVAKRGRGAGFLARPQQLDRFFEELFDGMEKDEALSDVRLSVKTRIGDSDPGEAARLIEIYNRYPICELIVHPRLRTDLYKNTPDLETFARFYEECRHPLCYNGDIFSTGACQEIARRFPRLQAVMMGRGLIMDPSLADQIRESSGQKDPAADGMLLEKYLLALREGYLTHMQDEQVVPRLKEIWYYMAWHYDRGIRDSRLMKNLRKVHTWNEFAQMQHLLLQQW